MLIIRVGIERWQLMIFEIQVGIEETESHEY